MHSARLVLALALLIAPARALATPLQDERPRRAAAPTEIDLPELDAHIGWSTDGTVYVDSSRTKRALTKADKEVDRPALLDAAIARAKEEGRLVLWYVPRIVEQSMNGVQMYRAPILDLYCRQVFFCDEDVAAIVAARYVPVRAVCDEPLAARFDLRPLDVIEPMVVLIDGDGNVVERIDRVRTFDGLWFADWLAAAARVHRPLDEARLAAASASELTALGEWERALAASAGDDDAQRLARAGALRRLRRGAQALAELDGLEQSGPAALVERGRVLLSLGRFEEARGVLLEAAKRDDAVAQYELALALLSLGDESGALRRFELVAQRFPDSLRGKRARANVHVGRDDLPAGAAFAGYENVVYLPESAYGLGARDTAWRGGALDPDALRTRGVQFLLRMQRDHGGWTDARYAYWPDSTITSNTWLAITALAARALLEHRDVDPAAVDAALLRAEAYMFDPTRLNRGVNEDVYADTYRMEYLARRAALVPADRELCERRLADLVGAAVARQETSGFFAHEYPNAFCTGAMLAGFLAARAVGVPVPEAALQRGADALLSARPDNGAFVYGGSAQGGRDGSLKDASARMPLCEAVLLQLGRGDPAHLSFAFENYWNHMDRLEKVRRNDFHSDGELAGFFFFHGLYHTSQSLAQLPDEVRSHHTRRLLEVLQTIPEIDGSYMDSHEFGKSYGTAMALLVLANIR